MKLTISQSLARKPKKKRFFTALEVYSHKKGKVAIRNIYRWFVALRDETKPTHVPDAITIDVIRGKVVSRIDTSIVPLSALLKREKGRPKAKNK